MLTSVDHILARIGADFDGLPYAAPTFEGDTITAHGMHFDARGAYEQLVAAIADRLQDDVIDGLGRTWPEVGGKPLFASADSGVACWCLDGRPWCAVGQLVAALAAHEND